MGDLADIKDHSPNPVLVEHIEKLLDLAKSGEIRGVVYCMAWDDSDATHGFVIDPRVYRKPLIGELTLLMHDLANDTGIRSGDSVLSRELGEY